MQLDFYLSDILNYREINLFNSLKFIHFLVMYELLNFLTNFILIPFEFPVDF